MLTHAHTHKLAVLRRAKPRGSCGTGDGKGNIA